MKTIELNKANSSLAEYVSHLEGGPLVVTNSGQPAAALLPLGSDTDWETVGLSINPEFVQMLEKSRQQLRQHAGTSLADVKKEFGVK